MSAIKPPRRRNRRWIWVFAAFAVFAVLAISINWVYNSTKLLTPEDLSTARRQWKQNRPASYDLQIETTVMIDSGTNVNQMEVQVRDGKVVSFLNNGKEPEPLLTPDGARNMDAERRQREAWDIDGLFNQVEEFVEKDRRDNNKSYLAASFDKNDGHLTQFIRRLKGHRVRITVKLRPPR